MGSHLPISILKESLKTHYQEILNDYLSESQNLGFKEKVDLKEEFVNEAKQRIKEKFESNSELNTFYCGLNISDTIESDSIEILGQNV